MAETTTTTSGGGGGSGTCFADLPEECVSHIVAHLGSPRAVAQASVASPGFLAASRSDAVWARFLPRSWRDMCAGAGAGIPTARLTHRDAFHRLCGGPGGSGGPPWAPAGTPGSLPPPPPDAQNQQDQQHHVCAWLDRGTGVVCRAVLARGLTICWGDTPSYWRWRPAVPGAWSPEVAELWSVCWLDVRARVARAEWTPGLRYTVSWRLAWAEATGGFDNTPVTVEVETSDGQASARQVLLDPPDSVGGEVAEDRRCVRRRAAGAPGWFEYDVGEFVVTPGEEEVEVAVGVWEHGGNWKNGLVVDAVLVRPSGLIPPPEGEGEGVEEYRTPLPTDAYPEEHDPPRTVWGIRDADVEGSSDDGRALGSASDDDEDGGGDRGAAS